MSTPLIALQDRLQTASTEFQKIQSDLTSAIDARQRLEAQQSENELVKKEFSTLTEKNTVYKLIGPVLVQQDQTEAKANVEKRLEFITSEIKRIEGQIKEFEEKAENKKSELVEIQTTLQQQMKAQSVPAAVTA